MVYFNTMKWLLLHLVFLFNIAVNAQLITGHIDSLIENINKGKYSKFVINDTAHMLGYKEREIVAYMNGDTIKKVVAKFRNSDRSREVYFGPGKDYENKVIYIKDYDMVTNELYAEVYVWERKLVKSIVSFPLNEDERNHPEKIIDRANYQFIICAFRNPK